MNLNNRNQTPGTDGILEKMKLKKERFAREREEAALQNVPILPSQISNEGDHVVFDDSISLLKSLFF